MKTSKECNKCKKHLKLECFYTDIKSSDGHRGQCKTCVKEVNKKYREKNPIKVKESAKKYRTTYPEKCTDSQKKSREISTTFKESTLKYNKKLKTSDKYIIRLLLLSGLDKEKITDDMINKKRYQLELKRRKTRIIEFMEMDS